MIPAAMQPILKNLIVGHEGKRNFPYPDTDKPPNITIGIGYNLSARGLPDSWINAQYDADVSYFYSSLTSDYPWFTLLDQNRQCALIDMCFMGYKKFQEFHDMLQAMAVKNYPEAARQIANSLWATELPTRAKKIETIILTGVI